MDKVLSNIRPAVFPASMNTRQKVVRWQSPSNIALVKYWGKHGEQLPQNPSLSLGLSKAISDIKLTYQVSVHLTEFKLHLLFEGQENKPFYERIKHYLKKLSGYFPFIDQMDIRLKATNSFPHSAGIASSASGMSALANCVCDIYREHFHADMPEADYIRLVSYMARLGSGSAARSVYGGFSVWGCHKDIPSSSDDYAVPYPFKIHNVFRDLVDAILIVDSSAKNVSSSQGHALMHGHPFAANRFQQARENLSALIPVLEEGDFESFANITEKEALSLHAMMMSSNPAYMLMKSGTIEIINKILKFREQKNIKLCYTLDAGPNVHLLFAREDEEEVSDFIKFELSGHCENGLVLFDHEGNGPTKISTDI